MEPVIDPFASIVRRRYECEAVSRETEFIGVDRKNMYYYVYLVPDTDP